MKRFLIASFIAVLTVTSFTSCTTSPAAVTTVATTYTVVKGDNLLKIAAKNGITINELMSLNATKFPSGLVPDGGRVFYESRKVMRDSVLVTDSVRNQIQALIVPGENLIVGVSTVAPAAASAASAVAVPVATVATGGSAFGAWIMGNLIPLLLALLLLFLLLLLLRHLLRNLETGIDRNHGRIEENSGRINGLEERVAANETGIAGNGNRLTDVESAVNTLAGEAKVRDSRLDAIDQALALEDSLTIVVRGDLNIGNTMSDSFNRFNFKK